jgi:hypothetical protein
MLLLTVDVVDAAIVNVVTDVPFLLILIIAALPVGAETNIALILLILNELVVAYHLLVPLNTTKVSQNSDVFVLNTVFTIYDSNFVNAICYSFNLFIEAIIIEAIMIA